MYFRNYTVGSGRRVRGFLRPQLRGKLCQIPYVTWIVFRVFKRSLAMQEA